MDNVARMNQAERSELFRETAGLHYRAMKEMIFGTVPEFDDIREVLGKLEREINETG